MSIQGSINQLLTATAVMARLDPNVERRTALGKEKRDYARAEKQRLQTTKKTDKLKEFKAAAEKLPETGAIDETGTPKAVLKESVLKTLNESIESNEASISRAFDVQEQAAQNIYDLDPSEENYARLFNIRGAKSAREQAIQNAQKSLNEAQEEKRPKSKRSFKNVQVDFGDGSLGTVGQLPTSWQKQINEQLKPAQRKALLAQTEPKENK